jgi:hypothetical protein
MEWEAGPKDPIEAMYSLAGCDWIIGPDSSFNRWSAFYGKVPRYEIQNPYAEFSLTDFRLVVDLGIPDELSVQNAEQKL